MARLSPDQVWYIVTHADRPTDELAREVHCSRRTVQYVLHQWRTGKLTCTPPPTRDARQASQFQALLRAICAATRRGVPTNVAVNAVIEAAHRGTIDLREWEGEPRC